MGSLKCILCTIHSNVLFFCRRRSTHQFLMTKKKLHKNRLLGSTIMSPAPTKYDIDEVSLSGSRAITFGKMPSYRQVQILLWFKQFVFITLKGRMHHVNVSINRLCAGKGDLARLNSVILKVSTRSFQNIHCKINVLDQETYQYVLSHFCVSKFLGPPLVNPDWGIYICGSCA